MDSNSKRIFTRLTNFEDKTMTAFSAEDLKQLQDIVNQGQKEIITLHDRDFIHQAFFIFSNAERMNCLYIEDFSSYEFIDKARSRNIRRDIIKNAVEIRNPENEGIMVSFKVNSINEINAQNFMLMADHYIPEGGDIEYFISNDDYKFHPILPNINQETVLPVAGDSISVVINLYPNGYRESPEVYFLGILYQNEIIDEKYGVIKIRELYESISFDGTIMPKGVVNA